MRSLQNSSEPSGCQLGSVIDSSRPPAMTDSLPVSRLRTMSVAESHGMSGWFHWSHARICPSGEMRGAATKSGPLTSTSGSDGWWAASRTISFTTSVAPDPVCRSRTQTRVSPSGLNEPSAKRSARGRAGVGGERLGFAAGGEPVQALVGPVGEPHHALAHPPGRTPVLVDGRSRVAPVRQEVRDRAVGRAADELGAAALRGASLTPVDVVAVEPQLPEADGLLDDSGRGERGGP